MTNSKSVECDDRLEKMGKSILHSSEGYLIAEFLLSQGRDASAFGSVGPFNWPQTYYKEKFVYSKSTCLNVAMV